MRNRVIIENVKPEIDGGRYYIKRTVGETVVVTADIFGDGHDIIRASVLLKHESEDDWSEFEMNALPNDAWITSFVPQKKGHYDYQVTAWVDNLTTWHKGFLKKNADGQHLDVELSIGVKLLTEAAEQYAAGEAKEINKYVKILANTKDYLKAIETVTTEGFAELILMFPLKHFVTEYPMLRVKVERDLAAFSAWYELFPRSTSEIPMQHGTLKDVERLLPRVAEFGFDILYMPPIHPVGEINRKGKNNSVTAKDGEPGSPWAIGSQYGGHKAVEPALGTLDDYVHLIQEAKKHGLEIALDLALQCAPDHPYIKENPQWFTWRPDGTIMYAENPPKKYQDIVPLNFECEDWENLWNELLSVVLFWVEKGITVFRVDNPHTKPIPFWEWCMAEVHKVNADVIFLAEAFTRPKIMGSLGKIGYTQSYSYFTWRVTKQEIIEYMTTLTQTESREYYRPNFWPNTPDILPFHLHNKNSNAFFLRYALAGTLSSNYGVYGAAYEFVDNVSLHGREEYRDSEKFEIKHYDWSARNRITDLMTLINRIRRSNKALQNTWNIHFTATSHENLLSYVKMDDVIARNEATEAGEPNIIWCVANLDTENTTAGLITVPKELLGIKKRVNLVITDLLTGETYYWKEDSNYVELNPYKSPMHIFKVHVYE